MRFLRLGPAGSEPVVADEGARLLEPTSLIRDVDGAFLAGGGVVRAREALGCGEVPAVDDPGDGSGLRVGAPIARPTVVLCIGQNYAAHTAESGATPPVEPIVFFKHPNTVVGAYDDVLPEFDVSGCWW